MITVGAQKFIYEFEWFVCLYSSVINYLPRCSYHLLYSCFAPTLPLPGGGMPLWRRKTEKNWKGNGDGYKKIK